MYFSWNGSEQRKFVMAISLVSFGPPQHLYTSNTHFGFDYCRKCTRTLRLTNVLGSRACTTMKLRWLSIPLTDLMSKSVLQCAVKLSLKAKRGRWKC